jgi:Transposase DDE domain
VLSGFFRKDEFRYDATQDAYVCPGGHELKPIRQGRLRDMRKDYANVSACRDCSLRERCTNTYRAVSRLENEDALERMEERLAERPDILDRRREIVEHPFGTIKQ